MIHGFLFLTNNNRDRDGHGPEFCKHMNRINKEAGTNITVSQWSQIFFMNIRRRANIGVFATQILLTILLFFFYHLITTFVCTLPQIYHSFHDEVKLYQQHWWRCNGPCQKQAPYFGMVRRSMNRAPGPSDFWWQRHQENCGGTYIKVREPENFKSKSKKSVESKKTPAKGKPPTNLDNYFAKPLEKPKPAMTIANGSLIPAGKPKSDGSLPVEAQKNPASERNDYKQSRPGNCGKPSAPAGLVKLGTSTNRVHGWGTGGPGSSCSGSSKSPSVSSNKVSGAKPSQPLSFVATLGGVGTGRSNLLDRYSSSSPRTGDNLRSQPTKKSASPVVLDTPPPKKPKIVAPTSSPVLRLNSPDVVKLSNCPICDLAVPISTLNDHLDLCLVAEDGWFESTKSDDDRRTDVVNESDVIVISPEKPQVPRSSRKSPKKPISMIGQTKLDAFVLSPQQTATKHYPCPVCNKSLDENLLNEHLDKCLTEPEKNGREEGAKRSVLIMEGPPARPGGVREPKDVVDVTDDIAGTGEPYVCLVCNVKIRGDIALNEHLDECVQSIFSDDSFDCENDDSSSIHSPADDRVKDDRFPCPICMELVAEKTMNQHLDNCLSGQNWD